MTSDEPAYRPCDDRLSQGDIVDGIPWGVIEHPVTICRPSDTTMSHGPARYGTVTDVDRAFRKRDGKEYVHAKAGCGRGIVLWHGCEIDSYLHLSRPQKKAIVAVAPIFSMADRLPDEHREAVRALRRYALFPLQAFAVDSCQFAEAYVDFRHIWSVKQSIVTDRLATLSDTARSALYAHLFTFLIRRRPAGERVCPSCNQLVPPDA